MTTPYKVPGPHALRPDRFGGLGYNALVDPCLADFLTRPHMASHLRKVRQQNIRYFTHTHTHTLSHVQAGLVNEANEIVPERVAQSVQRHEIVKDRLTHALADALTLAAIEARREKEIVHAKQEQRSLQMSLVQSIRLGRPTGASAAQGKISVSQLSLKAPQPPQPPPAKSRPRPQSAGNPQRPAHTPAQSAPPRVLSRRQTVDSAPVVTMCYCGPSLDIHQTLHETTVHIIVEQQYGTPSAKVVFDNSRVPIGAEFQFRSHRKPDANFALTVSFASSTTTLVHVSHVRLRCRCTSTVLSWGASARAVKQSTS